MLSKRLRSRLPNQRSSLPLLPVVGWSIGIREHDVVLVCKALDDGLVTAFALMRWTLGGELARLPPPAVAPLFDKLFGSVCGFVLTIWATTLKAFRIMRGALSQFKSFKKRSSKSALLV
jgi:hypothetical protein